MQESLMNKFLGYLGKHMQKKRWRAAAACFAAVVVFCTTYLLVLPAITMTKGYPSLSAEVFSAWSGDDLTVRVRAGTEEGGNDKVYVLTLEGYNADLSRDYYFSEEGTCTITDTEGKEIVLHRAIREDGKGAVDYWFQLEEAELTEFTLDLSDEVDPNRFAVMVEAMKNAAEEPETEDSADTAAKATASDAARPAAGPAAASGSGNEKATASNAAHSAAGNGTASPSDAENAGGKEHQPAQVYEEEEGFVQLLDGEIVNDLEGEEETESTETVASVKISAGFGKDFYAAVKDAARNADKRGDAQVKFSWKEMVQSERVITPEMYWSGDGAQVLMVFDGDAQLPEGAYLSVEEIPYGTEEYYQYLAQAEGTVIDPASGGKEERAVNFARFFDITILDPEGNEVQPAAPVRVIITCDESIRTREEDDVNVLHFKEEQTPEVVSSETVNSGSVAEEEADAVTFTAESFSVYGVVTTTIEKTVLASDGHTYKITVTCGTRAGIPGRAELAVREILPENASGEADPEYEEYTAKAGSMLGFSSAEYYRLFDISIVDPADPSIRYQPKEKVDVRVELLDAGESPEAFSVLHFDETAPEQLEAVTDGNTVNFSTGGFSAYAIIRGPSAADNGWTEVSSLEELSDLSGRNFPFYVSHKEGYYFTAVQEEKVGGKNRTGIRKTVRSLNDPENADGAALYYFEKEPGTENGYRVYCFEENGAEAEDDAVRKYVRQSGNSLSFVTDKNSASVFTVSMFPGETAVFRMLGAGGYYWNMQGGTGGKAFAAYNDEIDVNAKIVLEYKIPPDHDPYGLDGNAYGLMHYNGGLAGRALTASSAGENALGAVQMTVMTKQDDREDRLYVPKNSDISMWNFEWAGNDNYFVSTGTGEEIRYMNLTESGVTMAEEKQPVRVTPGSGSHEGQIRLSAASTALAYSGEIGTGFITGGLKSEDAWLNMVGISELGDEYFRTYSASKVSVSDTAKVSNGSRVIVYTRVWNETKKRYEFFALGHDGTLVPCYESGDSIEWIGTALNTLLWNFTEYVDAGTNKPNYYYELYNQYSKKFIAPQIKNGQLLSDEPIGININGRRYGDYYSTILAWDDPYYAYAGLRTENRKVVSGPMAQAEDFYFALMQDVPADDTFTEVPTVDHAQYGITMKMVDFNERKDQSDFLGDDTGGLNAPPKQGLLSTDLSGTDGFGYPSTVKTSKSLETLFDGATEVNKLFIESIYRGTGYFEFDSAQNYAHLDGNTFKVYKELGTNDSSGSRETLKHGQFFPYDEMIPGLFASANGKNLYSAEAKELPETDPRKYEQLHLISDPDYNFGMEMSASFVQTPDGLDAWGHDIIFEFSGDDDFWLYVDGELVIDLGGVHSALPGSVNFRTGEVMVNGKHTTLRELFKKNYKARNHTEAEAENYVNGLFVQNENGEWTFDAYTNHTMRMFYMERGKGASNLHMRFNLSAVKPGQVLLQKQLSGTDKPDYKLAEYAYQIQYRLSPDDEAPWLNLGAQQDEEKNVTYQNTNDPVKYKAEYTPAGSMLSYRNVFFLSAGQIAAITLPESAHDYRIIECGVNTQIYDAVKVNDEAAEEVNAAEAAAEEAAAEEADTQRKDFACGAATSEDRRRVVFDNHVSANAIRTLTITKKLFDVNGDEVTDDKTGFTFRLYLGSENDPQPSAAHLHEYCVKDPDGYYCQWDGEAEEFRSLEKKDFSSLTGSEQQKAVFHTSPNGAISRIPAGYHVEVRDLLVGTRFKVEERAGEIPVGYTFVEYVRDGASYITTEGEAKNAGMIRDNDSPAIEVHNRRGVGIAAEKVWSDAGFMESHGDIYLAVFMTKDGRKEMVEDSRRMIRHPSSQVTWYWDKLPDGVSLDDYEVLELTKDGSGWKPVDIDDPTLTVQAKSKESDTPVDYTYVATYTVGQITGSAGNVRNDIVTNSRHGILIEKRSWDGSILLPGAEFRLTDQNGNTVGKSSYTSGEDGIADVVYLNVGTKYTLTEIKAPAGYQTMEEPLEFVLKADGSVDVTKGSEGSWLLTQTRGIQAVLTVKDRPFRLKAVKQGVQKGSKPKLLGGVHFTLYKEVTVDGVTDRDPNPMPGYEDLVSEEGTGIIREINELLPAGTYYLEEKEAPTGYKGLEGRVKFTISPEGTVSLAEGNARAELTVEEEDAAEDNDPAAEGAAGTKVYTLRISNERFAVPVVIVKIDQQGKKLENAEFTLSGTGMAEQTRIVSKIFEKDGDAVIYRSDALGIGDYTLTETRAPAGCTLLEAPVTFKVEPYNMGIAVTVPEEQLKYANAEMIDPNDPEKGWKITVINTLGYAMPSTGGPGTRYYSVLGVLLTALSAGFFLLHRRRH